MNKKILVIGRGFLGGYIQRELEPSEKVYSTCYNDCEETQLSLDIREKNSIEKIINEIKPQCVINCAGNIQIDKLEKNPDLAYSINAEGAKNVAQISKNHEIRLIHISTDNVFDGTKGMYKEYDDSNPIHIYGKSKKLGEKFVSENSDNFVIIRTNFYGIDPKGRDLISKILQTLRENNPFFGFDDVIFNPLEVSNLSKMIYEFTKNDFRGIIHVSGDEVISKYQFARKVAEIFDFNTNLIKKGLIEDAKLFAPRPKNTSLSNQKSKKFLKTQIISLENSLRKIRTQIEMQKDSN